MKINYRDLGLKVGLEIHIQLNTGRKLFCHCPPIIKNEPPHFRIVRKLRVSLSELGQVDPAALWEFRKNRIFIYEGYHDCTCLVELDEEPPHEPDPESIKLSIAIAKRFNMKIFDELYVMRKIVIDGSNVSGFQRTILIAHNGLIKFFNYKVPIWTLCLEEDAARKIEEKGNIVVYRLDRLGIPLIEIATGPLEYNPNEIMEIAYYIGHTVKLTGKTKRGIGSIRQDLNISIAKGAKIEIKGIPDLSLIPKVIEYEVQRQLNLLKIQNELIERNAKPEDICEDYIDVSDIFQNTKSNILRKVLKEGGKVIAIKTPKFKGILGFEIQPGRRFGTELADRVRVWTNLSGLIHSDELPGYGISSDEVSKVYSRLNTDSFILIAGFDDREIEEAVKVIVERLRQAFYGVPEETRAANPDGTTRFMRPRPGASRMYPETDLRPIRITIDLIQESLKYVPETIETLLNKLVNYGLSKELAIQTIKSPYLDDILNLIEKFKNKLSPTIIASTFINTLKSIQREGFDIHEVTIEHMEEIFNLLVSNVIVKEAIPEIIKEVIKNPKMKILDIVNNLNLKKLSIEEVEKIVDEYINKGLNDKNKLIREIMKNYRGKIDANELISILDRKLSLK